MLTTYDIMKNIRKLVSDIILLFLIQQRKSKINNTKINQIINQ